MNQIRRLQHFNGQYFLNIPMDFAESSQLQKGDYFEVVKGMGSNMAIRKIANSDTPRTEVILEAMKNEAVMLAGMINALRSTMEGGEFSGRMAQFSHIQSKIRKLEKKLNPQI